jgi:hypothetical protein
VLGIWSPQSAVPEKNGARAEVYQPFRGTLIVVSDIVCILLYINIILIFLFSCCMCGLPRHTYNECLVFFGKPGATSTNFAHHEKRVTSHLRRMHCEYFMKISLLCDVVLSKSFARTW